MDNSQTIALYQPVLQSIAYRIVGSIQDAEDIVQDTFLKWLTMDHAQAGIQNVKAYLIRAVVNRCINHLETLKRKRDQFLDTINPDIFIEKYRESDFFKFDLENELSSAMAVLHKKLEPMEKAVFILREIFDFEYDELQVVLDQKKENCRQMLSRAKAKLQDTRAKKSEPVNYTQYMENFKNACNFGQFSAFINDLNQEIEAKFAKKK